MSAVEDVATAIAATVRAKGWDVTTSGMAIHLYPHATSDQEFCRLYCKDASQAKRLAEMMRGKA